MSTSPALLTRQLAYTTAPSDPDDEFVDDMAPAEPQPVHGSVKRPNTPPPAQTVPQRVDPAPRMAETMQMDRQPQAIPAPAVHPSEGEDHVNPSEGITPTVVPQAIPAPAVHPSEGEGHVSPSDMFLTGQFYYLTAPQGVRLNYGVSLVK